MPNIFKNFSRIKAPLYEFPDAKELKTHTPVSEPAAVSEPDPAGTTPESVQPEEETVTPEEEPIRYAQIQADSIIEDARRRAEEILEQARLDAEQECRTVLEAAREAGQATGYAQGIVQGRVEAKAELEKIAAQQEAEVQRFLERAGAAVDKYLDDSVEDLRDLSLAVAEKVVSVSLRSSSDVICRMIQTAVDKRKRREWVHIYIAECDAKRMGQVPASLTNALAALSDRVRIIPMADDESGTCIIEMPDEIIDASASTQLNNLRQMLTDAPSGGAVQIFNPFDQ